MLIVFATSRAIAARATTRRGNLRRRDAARPSPVTIPMRAQVIWTTAMRGQVTPMVQSRDVPRAAPALEQVAMPEGSSSAAPVISPGPSDERRRRMGPLRLSLPGGVAGCGASVAVIAPPPARRGGRPALFSAPRPAKLQFPNRAGRVLHLHVKAKAEDVDGTTVPVVGRVLDELIVARQPDPARYQRLVVHLGDLLRPVGQPAVADHEAVAALSQIVPVVRRQGVDDEGQPRLVSGARRDRVLDDDADRQRALDLGVRP